MLTSILFTYLVILQSCLLLADCKSCTKVTGHVCTCKLENGTLISLDALSGSQSPVFSDVKENGSTPANGNDYRYFYDPCRSFRLPDAGPACDGVSVCQKETSGVYNNLGELGKTAFGWNAYRDLYYVNYTGCFGGICRVTTVSLVCDWGRRNPMLQVFPQVPAGTLEYNMTLTSRCACPGGCPEEHHEAHMSSSGVFLLVLFVGALFYLVVGVAFRRIVVGATGAEMIPNRSFWASLPGLVRDGVTYCITCRRADAAYDQI